MNRFEDSNVSFRFLVGVSLGGVRGQLITEPVSCELVSFVRICQPDISCLVLCLCLGENYAFTCILSLGFLEKVDKFQVVWQSYLTRLIHRVMCIDVIS